MEKFLWCVPKNGLCKPCKVKILKDCPKTYRLDTVTDKIVFKVEEVYGLVGRNTCCLYYKDEFSAYRMYNKIQERNSSIGKRDIEKERTIISDLQKTIAEKEKEIEDLKIDLDICRNKLVVNMKEIRHQVCEEIRHKAKWRNPPSALQFIISAKDLKQIEQGESK